MTAPTLASNADADPSASSERRNIVEAELLNDPTESPAARCRGGCAPASCRKVLARIVAKNPFLGPVQERSSESEARLYGRREARCRGGEPDRVVQAHASRRGAASFRNQCWRARTRRKIRRETRRGFPGFSFMGRLNGSSGFGAGPVTIGQSIVGRFNAVFSGSIPAGKASQVAFVWREGGGPRKFQDVTVR